MAGRSPSGSGDRFRDALLSDGRGWILLSVSAGWAATIGARIVYPALLPEVRLEFGFGYATTGALVGLVWVSYGALQLPGGVLADATDHRTALVAGAAVTGLGLVAIAGAPAFGAFVLATVVMGAGTGIFGPSRVAVLSNAFPDHDSTAIGLSQAAGNVGNAVLPVAAGAIGAYAGWRLGFGSLVGLLVAVAAGLWLTVPPATGTETPRRSIRTLVARARDALAARPVYSGTGLLFLVMFVYQSLTGFLPTYLVDEKGLSGSTAATLYGGFFAAAVLAQVGAGPLADRFGIRRIVPLFAVASLPGFVTLVVAEGLVAVVLGVVLLSALLGCFPPAHAYTVGVVPPDVQGTGYGAIRTVYIGCGAAGPVVTGVVADAVGFAVAVLALGALTAGIVGLGAALPPDR